MTSSKTTPKTNICDKIQDPVYGKRGGMNWQDNSLIELVACKDWVITALDKYERLGK